jgi:hypothetical protein
LVVWSKKKKKEKRTFILLLSFIGWVTEKKKKKKKKKWREIYWCWCHALLYSLIVSRSSFAYVDLVKQQRNILTKDDVSLYQTFKDNQ